MDGDVPSFLGYFLERSKMFHTVDGHFNASINLRAIACSSGGRNKARTSLVRMTSDLTYYLYKVPSFSP